MATKTDNYGLIMPDKTDPVKIEDLNKNFETIDRELKSRVKTVDGSEPDEDGDIGFDAMTYFDLDLTTWVAVDFANKEGMTFQLTEYEGAEELLSRTAAGRTLRVKFKGVDATPHTIIMGAVHTQTVTDGVRTVFSSTEANIYYDAYSNYSLNVLNSGGEYSVWFNAFPFLTGEGTVKSVNGVLPDENGNVEIEQVKTTDLTIDWENGKVTQVYSDGTTRTADMTFNADGIPTKIGDMKITISGVS